MLCEGKIDQNFLPNFQNKRPNGKQIKNKIVEREGLIVQIVRIKGPPFFEKNLNFNFRNLSHMNSLFDASTDLRII